MDTIIYKQDLATPAQLLKSGQVVAFPTETVYGLGANALDKEAVKQVFAVKGRPSDNPLIVHVESFEQAKKYIQTLVSYKNSITFAVLKFDISKVN